MLKMSAAGCTDPGRIRQNNEDSFIIENGFIAVADGMGGAAAGEIASLTALNILSAELKDLSCSPEKDLIKKSGNAVDSADSEIKSLVKKNPKLEGMGTTVVFALNCDDRVLVGNVGDSRAYMIKPQNREKPSFTKKISDSASTAIYSAIGSEKPSVPGSIQRITKDHSFVMEMVEAGIIKEDDIRSHPMRNHITRSVGLLRDQGADITSIKVEKGDVILLCSDGLWEMVHEDLMLAIVNSSVKPDEICHKLVEAANNSGGVDNITVITAIFH